MTNQTFQKLIFVVVLTALICGCSNEKSNNTEVSDTLRIDGSSTVFPLTERIVEQYNRQFGDLMIIRAVSGTGGGFSKFSQGAIEINNASRKIQEREKEECEKNDVDYIELKIAIDGIAVVANIESNWISSLTVAELKKIWSNDSIQLWSDVRPSWPNETIVLYSPGKASGTYDYFKEELLGDLNFRKDVKMSENDNLLVLGVSNNVHALGFFALSYAENNKTKVKTVAIDNGNGPITPELSTVSSGAYSPLSRPLFIYVNNDFIGNPIGKKFTRFYLNNCATIAKEVGYVPLSAQEYAASSAAL